MGVYAKDHVCVCELCGERPEALYKAAVEVEEYLSLSHGKPSPAGIKLCVKKLQSALSSFGPLRS